MAACFMASIPNVDFAALRPACEVYHVTGVTHSGESASRYTAEGSLRQILQRGTSPHLQLELYGSSVTPILLGRVPLQRPGPS